MKSGSLIPTVHIILFYFGISQAATVGSQLPTEDIQLCREVTSPCVINRTHISNLLLFQ